MTRIVAFIAAALFSINALAATCSVSDVKIEGVSAQSCSGMYRGNVNSLEDINTALGTSYDTIDPLNYIGRRFTLDADISGVIEIVLKQNTNWATYRFDLSTITNLDDIWSGVWSTRGEHWDNNTRRAGCQGCGGLSHGFVVSSSTVPVPGTLGLLGIGLAGLIGLRRKS